MLEIRERASEGRTATADLTLRLPFQERQRSRARVLVSSGEEAALLLPRGSVLRGGDLMVLSDGRVARVVAADETVSTARARDAHCLLRAAYHLGNRHVPLELGSGFVRYLHDHVLDGLVRELGLEVTVEDAAFEPESGAYGRHAHGHAHPHAHAHGDGDDDGHAHDHVHLPRRIVLHGT